VSSRDFSGPYGPDPREADELGGGAWRGRPAGRGYRAGDDARHGQGYDQGAEYDTDPAHDWGGREGAGGYGHGGYGGEYAGVSSRGGAYGPRGQSYGRRQATYGPEGGWYRQDDPGPAVRRDTQVRYGRQARGSRYGGYGRRGTGYSGERGPGAPGGPGGPGRGHGPGLSSVKASGSWWRHWTWRKALGVAGTAVGGLILAGVTGVGVAYAETPVPTDASQAAVQQQSTVYFSDGKTVLGTFGTTDRQLLSYNQIPKVVRDAVLAAEDRNFYHEGGVSPRGILRAAYEDVFHGGGSGGNLSGGSTITQEFVRNYYAGIGRQQTFTRKIKEIFVALKVARQKSKAWILTQYLNTIYLGDGAYGIQAAAETYFGKPAWKLDVAQAAMIAAIIQEPGYFPTPAGHQALVQRWHYVLSGMVKMGDLTAAQAAAEKFPKVTGNDQQSAGSAPYVPYILQAVRHELDSPPYNYTKAQLDNDGLRIVTTVSKPMMDALYKAVDANEKLMAAGGKALPWYAHVGAVLQDPQTGAILAMYPGPGQNMPPSKCHKLLCDYNTALEAREQVGSSFKPYVLSAAVKQGMNVKTSMLDGYSPLWIPPDTEPQVYASRTPKPPPYYKVHNDVSDGSQGPVSVLKATAMSLNTAYTDLIHRVGTKNVVSIAQQFGVNVPASGLPSEEGTVGMALGEASITVGEQASMLATIDDNGEYHSQHIVKQITQNGKIIPTRIISRQVLTPAQASEVAYAMSADTSSMGTAPSAAMSDGRPIIGKTGTTNDAQSAFFIGAIPQYALAVGIFSNEQNGKNQETLNDLGGTSQGGYGGWWPAKIWNTFAEAVFAALPIEQFPAPVFTGAAWNMLGPGPVVPTPAPSATPTPAPAHTRRVAPPPSPRPRPHPSSSFPSPPPVPTCGGLIGGGCASGKPPHGGPPTNGSRYPSGGGGAAGGLATPAPA
jgi:membrane peptidoglycan carboxypeptidase